ncbi:serine protease [Candidatus Parcubacteria bacterium]|nr:serine protease [Candidatus Parcubacteria bacterium]
MSKNILSIIAIFIIGTVGGIFADQILWPYFIERPLFLEYRLEQAPVYITEIRETVIQENTALENAIEKVEKTVINIRTEKKSGKVLNGSGLVVTSDGLAVTLAELVPQGSTFNFYIKEGSDFKKVKGQVIKRDLENNLGLIKIEAADLTATGFADLDKIKLGQRIFLISTEFSEKKSAQSILPKSFVNQGIISSFNQESITTNIFEKNNVLGSPLFDIEANVLGINTLDSENRIITIPITKIKTFLGF